jgi:hypothetical protein
MDLVVGQVDDGQHAVGVHQLGQGTHAAVRDLEGAGGGGGGGGGGRAPPPPPRAGGGGGGGVGAERNDMQCPVGAVWPLDG